MNVGTTVETLRRHMLVDVVPIVIDLEKSQGNRLVDAVSGKSYLDCFGYVASQPIGHNHPGLSDPAFQEMLLRAALSKPSCSDFAIPEMAYFVETFARVAKPAEVYSPFLYRRWCTCNRKCDQDCV